VDEIGTEAEALACRTIAERGVTLIATAHGLFLENLIKNPTLSGEAGGAGAVLVLWRAYMSTPGGRCCLASPLCLCLMMVPSCVINTASRCCAFCRCASTCMLLATR
jgi:hypothetical protein